MPSTVEAGRAGVTIFSDDSQLVRGLRGSEQRINRFSARIASAGAGLLGFGAGLSAPLIAAIDSSSELTETMNKFDVVFADRSVAVKAWGDDFAGTVGRSKQVVADFLGSTQDLFVPIGFDASSAEKMSKEVTGLAVDLASFNNEADSDVLRDLHAALTGSGEVMKKYGVIVSEAAVKQELLNQSLDPKVATDQQKVQARWNIILRGTTSAQGDAIRSAEAYANQKKRLTGTIKDAAAAVGSKLEPAAAKYLSKAADAVAMSEKWASANPELITGLATVAAGAVGAGAGLLGLAVAGKVVAIGIGVATTAVSAIGTAIGIIASPIGLTVAAIAGVGYAADQYFGISAAAIDALTPKWNQLHREGTQAVDGITDALYAGDVGAAADVLWAGLKLQWAKGLAGLNEEWSAWKNAAIGTVGESFYGIGRSIDTFLLDTLQQAATWSSGILDILDDTLTDFSARWDRESGVIAQDIVIPIMTALNPDLDEADIQQSLQEELKGRDTVRDSGHTDRTDKRAETLDKAERELTTARRRIRDEYNAARSEMRSGLKINQTNALQSGRTAIDAARSQFDEATAKAEKLRADAKAANAAANKKNLNKTPGDEKPQSVAGTAADKTEGTFDAAAIAGLGSIQVEQSTPADKAADAIDEVGTKLADQSSQWNQWGKTVTKAAQTAAASLAVASTVAATPVEASPSLLPEPTAPPINTGELPPEPFTEPVKETDKAIAEPFSRRALAIERRIENPPPRVRPETDFAAADRFKTERQNIADSRTQRPVRPHEDDHIGRAHAIADQSRSLDPGDVLNTNAGNVDAITRFSDANRRFERSQGIDTRPDPLPRSLPEPATPFRGYDRPRPEEPDQLRRIVDPADPKRSRREIAIARRNERRGTPDPAVPDAIQNVQRTPEPVPDVSPVVQDIQRTTQPVEPVPDDVQNVTRRTRREIAIARRNERQGDLEAAPDLQALEQPAAIVLTNAPELPELVLDVTPELAALNLDVSPIDAETERLVQNVDTAPSFAGSNPLTVGDAAFPDYSRAFEAMVESLDSIDRKTPETAPQSTGGIRIL